MSSLASFVQKLWDRKISRFLVVGLFNTALDFTLLNIMVELLGFHVLVANTISVSVGITVSYFLNHHIVFRHPERPSPKNYARFFAITGFSVLFIQNVVIYVVTKVVTVNEASAVHMLGYDISAKTIEVNLAKAVAVLTGMVWNFLLYKYVIFRIQGDEAEPENILV